MTDTRPVRAAAGLPEVLDVLVDRGTITAAQRVAILAEVARPVAAADIDRGSGPTPRRRLTEILIEVGLYVGSALVLAAGFVLVAQNWDAMGLGTHVAILSLTALATGGLGFVLGRGSVIGTSRRRLAGVLFAASAASGAGTVGLLMDDARYTGMVALGLALVVMVCANVVASSTITELGMFVAAYALAQSTVEALRPTVGARFEGSELSGYELGSLGVLVALGVLWALVVSPRLVHRELAVFVGMFAAFFESLTIVGQAESETVGIAILAVLAALGFWRFLVEGYWPWLASAIASLTATVFWAAGGADRPVVAILLAGLVLLGSSGLGLLASRRRGRRAASASPAS